MNEAVERMLSKYRLDTAASAVRALREILQEIALLGLWRAKFFEEAAFYGGTALRTLYGLDRFSEDLDFSLIRPDSAFDLSPYANQLKAELKSFGFDVEVISRATPSRGAIQSAFLKADTFSQLLVVRAGRADLTGAAKGQVLKIKLEVDINPPGRFETETRYLLNPIPFSVRVYSLPDLFAGKMHALLCRRWKTRVKGRDWYDFAWFAAHYPGLNLTHLRERLVQSGHWVDGAQLDKAAFLEMLGRVIGQVDLDMAREEVAPFLEHPDNLEVWSKNFFLEMAKRIRFTRR